MDNWKKDKGIKLLINRFTNQFEVEENINYYLFKDFVRARRKYLKYMLEGACGLYDPFLVAPDVGYFRLSCLYNENGQRKEKDFLYKTDKGGMSWDILDTPGGEIYYLNESIIYSLGKDIERSTDGGQNWQFVKTVKWEGQFSFVDQNTAWVVAADKSDWENPIFALVKTTNGCSTFETIVPVLLTSQTLR